MAASRGLLTGHLIDVLGEKVRAASLHIDHGQLIPRLMLPYRNGKLGRRRDLSLNAAQPRHDLRGGQGRGSVEELPAHAPRQHLRPGDRSHDP